MISKVGNGDIKIDEITALYLKDKEGNIVELDKGLFTYDYCCNGYGKKELYIECDLNKPTITITTNNEISGGCSIPNNTFDREYNHAKGYSSSCEGYSSK